MAVLDLFKTYIVEPWRMIADAPVPYLMTAIVIGLAIWAAHKWAYGHRLEKKDDTIALLDREVADYKRKLDGATPDEARAKIDELKEEIQQFKRQFGPRTFTPHQKKAFISCLSKYRDQKVSLCVDHDATGGDCNRYAREIAAAIVDATGWPMRQGTVIGPSRTAGCGLALIVRDAANLPPAAMAIAAAFHAAGVPFEIISPSPHQDIDLTLLVSAKVDS